MIVVNVKHVGGCLHSCCRMMLTNIFVLSKYDQELCNDKRSLEFMQNVESNIFWFIGVYVTYVAIFVQICENCCHLLAHVNSDSCVVISF